MDINKQIKIQLGEFELYLIASPINLQHVLEVQSLYSQFITVVDEKIDDSLGRLFILSAIDLESANISNMTLVDEIVPRQFFTDLVGAYKNYLRAHSLGLFAAGNGGSFTFTWPHYRSNEMGDNKFCKSSTLDLQKTFNAFVVEEYAPNIHIRILLYLLFIATCWHIERGGLYLHSSAVQRSPNNGFLFLGASGNGKTTVAKLSVEAGYSALGDDLNFIIKDQNGFKLAAAPSVVQSLPNYSKFSPSLRAIFRLVKDDHDELVPLSPIEISKYLLESLKQIPKASLLTDEVFQQAFKTAAFIARCVPGYELHFRKTKEFWRIIDEKFPS